MAAAAGLLVTAPSSSSGDFISTAPLRRTFAIGALAAPATTGASFQSVISRDGTRAFITKWSGGGQVASYERDPVTGALGAQVPVQLTEGNQSGHIALTPDGTKLFTVTFDGADSWIDEFTISRGGPCRCRGRPHVS
jgi:6-phosphogluconolactonase (cycloisomerase 2 family)